MWVGVAPASRCHQSGGGLWGLARRQLRANLTPALRCTPAAVRRLLHTRPGVVPPGNLYVTRYADGNIVLLSPSGATLKTIQLPLSTISNVELGGADGKLLIGVGRCAKPDTTRGCVATAKADAAPGRAWSMLQAGKPARMG